MEENDPPEAPKETIPIDTLLPFIAGTSVLFAGSFGAGVLLSKRLYKVKQLPLTHIKSAIYGGALGSLLGLTGISFITLCFLQYHSLYSIADFQQFADKIVPKWASHPPDIPSSSSSSDESSSIASTNK